MAKIGLLLIFLQLWQFAFSNRLQFSVVSLPQLSVSNTTVVNLANLIAHETKFPIQIKNKFYYVENSVKVNWYQAEHNCRIRGGHLLNIESSEEMDAVLALIPSDRYWVSANCLAGNRDWISTATGMFMPYLRWLPGEPNNLNGIESCVEIKRTALNDERCFGPFLYICEAKIMY